MIITGAHWFMATVIAVSVHLAGMLWLSIASPNPEAEVESASQGIVVALGRDARKAAESPEVLEPETGATVSATAEPEPRQPDTTLDALQPELSAAAEPAPREPAAEPDLAPTPDALSAASVSPETVESRQLDEAAAVAPESARTPAASQPGTVEPDTAESRQAADVTMARAPTVASEAVSGPSPDAAETVAVEEAPSRPEPPVESAQTPETTVVAATGAEVAPSDTVPIEFADDAPVPEPSDPPATVREVETANAATVPTLEMPAVNVSRSEPAGRTAAPVADVETAPADRGGPRVALEAVEPETGGVTDVDMVAARQPAPEVQEMSEPEVTETTTPETVSLQELQERSGGAGVVARYAGVLKGWLQENMHYPRAARVAGQEGDAVVRFVIDREGNVQSVELESGSGYSLLDREATEMVERGNPFPAMPGDMPGERLEVRVPVSFQVRDDTRSRHLPPIYLE